MENEPKKDDVRRCECHGMYFRPCMISDDGVVLARATKNRDTWSGEDWVKQVLFRRDEWEALERV